MDDWDKLVKNKAYITDLGKNCTMEFHTVHAVVGRYDRSGIPKPNSNRHFIAEEGNNLEELMERYDAPPQRIQRLGAFVRGKKRTVTAIPAPGQTATLCPLYTKGPAFFRRTVYLPAILVRVRQKHSATRPFFPLWRPVSAFTRDTRSRPDTFAPSCQPGISAREAAATGQTGRHTSHIHPPFPAAFNVPPTRIRHTKKKPPPQVRHPCCLGPAPSKRHNTP